MGPRVSGQDGGLSRSPLSTCWAGSSDGWLEVAIDPARGPAEPLSLSGPQLPSCTTWLGLDPCIVISGTPPSHPGEHSPIPTVHLLRQNHRTRRSPSFLCTQGFQETVSGAGGPSPHPTPTPSRSRPCGLPPPLVTQRPSPPQVASRIPLAVLSSWLQPAPRHLGLM